MSRILDLAQDFEQRSKQQAQDTERHLRNEFERHERSIAEALRSSEQRICADISARNRRMSRVVLKTWLWLLLSIILVLAGSSGVIWWQERQIVQNMEAIKKQRAMLSELEKRGGKIQMSKCGEKKRLCVKIDLSEEAFGSSETGIYPWMIPEGY